MLPHHQPHTFTMTPKEIRDAKNRIDDVDAQCPLPRMQQYEKYDKDFFRYKCRASPSKVIERLQTAARENEEYRKCSLLPVIAPNPPLNEEKHRILIVATSLHTHPGTTFCFTYENNSKGGVFTNLLLRRDEPSMVGFVTRGVFLVELGRMEQEGMIEKVPTVSKPGGWQKGAHREMFERIEAWDKLQRKKWRGECEKTQKGVDQKGKSWFSRNN